MVQIPLGPHRRRTRTSCIHRREHLPARVFAPGTTPAYSPYAFTLMGYIVQRVSGERFEDYVANHIFKPLGMTHSTFEEPL